VHPRETQYNLSRLYWVSLRVFAEGKNSSTNTQENAARHFLVD
jgi:hypothetical protein